MLKNVFERPPCFLGRALGASKPGTVWRFGFEPVQEIVENPAQADAGCICAMNRMWTAEASRGNDVKQNQAIQQFAQNPCMNPLCLALSLSLSLARSVCLCLCLCACVCVMPQSFWPFQAVTVCPRYYIAEAEQVANSREGPYLRKACLAGLVR